MEEEGLRRKGRQGGEREEKEEVGKMEGRKMRMQGRGERGREKGKEV